MTQQTIWRTSPASPLGRPIDAVLEIGAYEALWCDAGATFKTISDKLRSQPDSRPSDFVPEEEARPTGLRVINRLRSALDAWFDIRLHGECEYPQRLRDAVHPIELLYYQGDWSLTSQRSVAVVGTRSPSEDGKRRTRHLVRKLVEDNFAIVSGLADGIDTAAHEAALEFGGSTIAVLGTPLDAVYPRKNGLLQRLIADQHLLISQVPVERYAAQPNVRLNSWFFPERNKTMSALTEATVIVEAGETSGTLVQARAALQQKRKLFIMNSCFENPALKWPWKYLEEGAVRVRDYDDVRRQLVE